MKSEKAKAEGVMNKIPRIDEFVKTLPISQRLQFSKLLIKVQTKIMKILCGQCYDMAIRLHGDIQTSELCTGCRKKYLVNQQELVDWLNRQYEKQQVKK